MTTFSDFKSQKLKNLKCLNPECDNNDLRNAIILNCNNGLCENCSIKFKGDSISRVLCEFCNHKHNIGSYLKKISSTTPAASSAVINKTVNFFDNSAATFKCE